MTFTCGARVLILGYERSDRDAIRGRLSCWTQRKEKLHGNSRILKRSNKRTALYDKRSCDGSGGFQANRSTTLSRQHIFIIYAGAILFDCTVREASAYNDNTQCVSYILRDGVTLCCWRVTAEKCEPYMRASRLQWWMMGEELFK